MQDDCEQLDDDLPAGRIAVRVTEEDYWDGGGCGCETWSIEF